MLRRLQGRSHEVITAICLLADGVERVSHDRTTVTFRASSFDLSESDDFGFRGGATFNVPLGDNLALRASVDYYDDPGFIDTPFLVRQPGLSDPEPDFTDPAAVAANLYGDKDVDGEQTVSGRIALRWQPGDIVDYVCREIEWVRDQLA